MASCSKYLIGPLFVFARDARHTVTYPNLSEEAPPLISFISDCQFRHSTVRVSNYSYQLWNNDHFKRLQHSVLADNQSTVKAKHCIPLDLVVHNRSSTKTEIINIYLCIFLPSFAQLDNPALEVETTFPFGL